MLSICGQPSRSNQFFICTAILAVVMLSSLLLTMYLELLSDGIRLSSLSCLWTSAATCCIGTVLSNLRLLLLKMFCVYSSVFVCHVVDVVQHSGSEVHLFCDALDPGWSCVGFVQVGHYCSAGALGYYYS